MHTSNIRYAPSLAAALAALTAAQQAKTNAALLGLWEDKHGGKRAAQVTVAQVQAALDGGADVNAKDATGWTALTWAALTETLQCVTRLVSKGADVNTANRNGWTPLMAAAT